MNAAHLHLVLNHFPVIGTLFVVALLGAAVVRESDELARAALWFAVATSLLAIPTFFSGHFAEEIVESLPGVTEHLIENHEDVAHFAFAALLVCGAASLGGLYLFRAVPIPRRFAIGLLIALVVTFGLTAWTARLGGEIRHTETRPGFQ